MPGIKRCPYQQGQQMEERPHKLTLPAQVLPVSHSTQVVGGGREKSLLKH